MTGPTIEQAKQIGALALEWAQFSATDKTNQAAAGDAKVKAETLRRFLEANRGLVDIGVAEYNRKDAEFQKLKAAADNVANDARASAQAMQDAHDRVVNYINEIVENAVPEAPLGGFR